MLQFTRWFLAAPSSVNLRMRWGISGTINAVVDETTKITTASYLRTTRVFTFLNIFSHFAFFLYILQAMMGESF